MTFSLDRMRRFLRSEDAAVSVEAAIMMPALIILFVAGYTYFDAYRKGAVLVKASSAISDALSRQDSVVTPEYIDGLHGIFEFITATEGPSFVRVSQLRHQNGEVQVIWSYVTGTATDEGPMDQDKLQAYLRHIPTMKPNEHMVAVEASSVYAPAFNIGLPIRRAYSMIASRQRKGTPFIWDPDGAPTGSVFPEPVNAVAAGG